MTVLSISVQLLFFALSFSAATPDCPEAARHASDAYSYARKAYRADNLRELRDYARKAKSSAEDARVAAGDCKCDDAETLADDAASYAKKAYDAGDFDDAVSYAKKAMTAAEDLETAANDCSKNGMRHHR